MTIDHLTPKHQKCAQLVARGLSNSEIAETLGIRVRTVKAYLKHIFDSVGICNGHKRTKLAAMMNHDQHPHTVPTSFQINRRSYAVAALVARGLTNSEVATILGTTENMVKNYARLLFDLSGMSNRTEFCAWWSAHHEGAILDTKI